MCDPLLKTVAGVAAAPDGSPPELAPGSSGWHPRNRAGVRVSHSNRCPQGRGRRRTCALSAGRHARRRNSGRYSACEAVLLHFSFRVWVAHPSGIGPVAIATVSSPWVIADRQHQEFGLLDEGRVGLRVRWNHACLLRHGFLHRETGQPAEMAAAARVGSWTCEPSAVRRTPAPCEIASHSGYDPAGQSTPELYEREPGGRRRARLVTVARHAAPAEGCHRRNAPGGVGAVTSRVPVDGVGAGGCSLARSLRIVHPGSARCCSLDCLRSATSRSSARPSQSSHSRPPV